jgi:hypothetical protein
VVKSKARLKTDRLFIAINYFPVNIDHKSVIVVQEYIPEKTTFIFSRDFGAKHQPSPSLAPLLSFFYHGGNHLSSIIVFSTMERIEPDQTPSQSWKLNLDATCNRLMSHYLSLLRAGTSDGIEENGELGHDSRGV